MLNHNFRMLEAHPKMSHPVHHRRALQVLSLVCAFLLLAAWLPSSAQVADPADRWMNQGATALRQGNIPEAEQDFQHAVTASPRDADAYLGLGMAQLREGKLDTAVQSLATASELKPSIASAHMFRGIALFQMNSIDPAIDQLKEEIKLQPNDTEALTWLGIIEIQAGKPEDACGPLDRAAQLNPKDQNVLFYQVRAHTLSAQHAFRDLYKINPDSWFVHRAQAEIDSEAHQPDKAIEEYKAAIKVKPGDPDLYEALGDEEQKVGHPLEATNAYQTELTTHPNDPIALFNLGKIQVETGDPTQGVAYLRQAVEAHAAPGPTDFYLGLGLSKLGQNEEASTWLERALTDSPSDFIRQSDYYELVRVYQKLGRKEDSERALEQLKKLKAQASPAGQP
jgi:tetratricopeptide (TPR) repeat protein